VVRVLAALAADRLGLPPLTLALPPYRPTHGGETTTTTTQQQQTPSQRALGPYTRPAADVRCMLARPCDLRPLAALCAEIVAGCVGVCMCVYGRVLLGCYEGGGRGGWALSGLWGGMPAPRLLHSFITLYLSIPFPSPTTNHTTPHTAHPHRECTEFEAFVEKQREAAQEDARAAALREARQQARADSCLICLEGRPTATTLCCGGIVHSRCLAQVRPASFFGPTWHVRVCVCARPSILSLLNAFAHRPSPPTSPP
jgi:hypothetical protein